MSNDYSIKDVGSSRSNIETHRGSVNSVAFNNTGDYLVTGSDDMTAKVWRLLPDSPDSPENAIESCVATLNGHSGSVSSVAFNNTGDYLVTGSHDGTAKLWYMPPNGAAATCVATLDVGKYVTSVDIFEPFVATGSVDGTAKVWRLSPHNIGMARIATCVATLEGHDKKTGWVSSVKFDPKFDPTGRFMVTGSHDMTAKVWRISPKKSDLMFTGPVDVTCVATLTGEQGHRGWVNSVAFHPTVPLVATGSHDGTAKLWYMPPNGAGATWVANLVHARHDGSVLSVAFDPTGHFVATGCNSSAKLWRMSSDGKAKMCAELYGHGKSVKSVAFHPTGPFVATGSDDTTTRLWKWQSGPTGPTQGGRMWRVGYIANKEAAKAYARRIKRRGKKHKTRQYKGNQNDSRNFRNKSRRRSRSRSRRARHA
jgi:WD40 repeat protein